jgi:uncharacterized protein (DUF697 family)
VRTPDITPAQVAAIVKLILGLALALGLPLSPADQAELVSAVTAIAGLIIWADAKIRHGRATGNVGAATTKDEQ